MNNLLTNFINEHFNNYNGIVTDNILDLFIEELLCYKMDSDNMKYEFILNSSSKTKRIRNIWKSMSYEDIKSICYTPNGTLKTNK